MIRFLHGDCRDVLRSLPAVSVQACVTSPPYYALRDYSVPPSIWGGDPSCEHEWGDDAVVVKGGPPSSKSTLLGNGHIGGNPKQHEISRTQSNGAYCQHCNAWRGCLGLEPSPDLFVEHLVEVFREVWRVLRDDGVLWCNIGDSYMASGGSGAGGNAARMGRAYQQRNVRPNKPIAGIKPKDLIGIPWMTAFALRADGWYLRRDIIWHKVSSMPESVTDRPSTAHEYVFLLTKSADYFYDAAAIAEPAVSDHPSGNGFFGRQKGVDYRPADKGGAGHKPDGTKEQWTDVGGTRNARSVWSISPTPFAGKHFATMPTTLAEKLILAGTSEVGCSPACGAPWERVITKGKPDKAWQRLCGGDAQGDYNGVSSKYSKEQGLQNPSEVKK